MFSKPKRSTNLLEILPKIYFIRNFVVLDLKLLFFEIFFMTRKVIYSVEILVLCIPKESNDFPSKFCIVAVQI